MSRQNQPCTRSIRMPLIPILFIYICISFYLYWLFSKRHTDSTTLTHISSNRHSLCASTSFANIQVYNNRSAYMIPRNRSIITNNAGEVISSRDYANYTEFKELIRRFIQKRVLYMLVKPIRMIFADLPYEDLPQPFCDGLWLEFVSVI